MANYFVKIQTITVGSGGAANINFTSIPQTYTDLKLVLSGRTTDSGSTIANATFNGSSSNITTSNLVGTGSSTAAGTSTNIQLRINWSASTSNVFGNAELYIPNYTLAINKSAGSNSVNENQATEAYSNLSSHLWSVTSAITQITLTPTAGNFVEHSTATLYGIKSS